MRQNKRLLPYLLLALLCLALLAGCGLPTRPANGAIPNTGPQLAQDYPPGSVSETPEPTEPYDDSEEDEDNDNDNLEILDSPEPSEPTATVTLTGFLPPAGLSPTVSDLLPAFPTLAVSAYPAPQINDLPTAETASPEASPSVSITPSLSPSTSPTPSEPAVSPTLTAAAVRPTPLVSASPAVSPSPTATETGPARESLLGREQFFSELAASQVRNLTDGEIGAVNGMIFDSLSGAPVYAVVAPKWLLGLSRGSVPVPWGALNLAGQGIYQPQAGILLLPVAGHVLNTAPTIDRDMWDGQSPPADWDTGITDYWVNFVPIVPVTGAAQVRSEPLLVDDSLLNGLSIDVTSSEGETLGRVRDLVLDANGNVRYALVLVDDFIGMGGRLAPVPWRRLVWSPGGWFILQGSPSALRAAPGYPNRSAFPDFTQLDWDREIRGYWGE